MSFIEMNGLDDVTEPQVITENLSLNGAKKINLTQDYTLVIEDVKEKDGEDGGIKGLLILHSVDGHPDCATVMHNLALPLPGDDDEKRKNKLRFAKRYLSLFKIPFANGIDVANMPGKRATAKLTLEEYEGQLSNKIVLPQFK